MAVAGLSVLSASCALLFPCASFGSRTSVAKEAALLEASQEFTPLHGLTVPHPAAVAGHASVPAIVAAHGSMSGPLQQSMRPDDWGNQDPQSWRFSNFFDEEDVPPGPNSQWSQRYRSNFGPPMSPRSGGPGSGYLPESPRQPGMGGSGYFPDSPGGMGMGGSGYYPESPGRMGSGYYPNSPGGMGGSGYYPSSPRGMGPPRSMSSPRGSGYFPNSPGGPGRMGSGYQAGYSMNSPGGPPPSRRYYAGSSGGVEGGPAGSYSGGYVQSGGAARSYSQGAGRRMGSSYYSTPPRGMRSRSYDGGRAGSAYRGPGSYSGGFGGGRQGRGSYSGSYSPYANSWDPMTGAGGMPGGMRGGMRGDIGDVGGMSGGMSGSMPGSMPGSMGAGMRGGSGQWGQRGAVPLGQVLPRMIDMLRSAQGREIPGGGAGRDVEQLGITFARMLLGDAQPGWPGGTGEDRQQLDILRDPRFQRLQGEYSDVLQIIDGMIGRNPRSRMSVGMALQAMMRVAEQRGIPM